MKLKGVVRGLKKGLVTALAVTMFATSLPSVPAFATEGTENAFFEETDVFEAAETDAVVTDVELEEENAIVEENIAQEVDGQETIADENATEDVDEKEIADDTDVSETVDEEADAEVEEEVIEEEVEAVEEAALALQNTVSLVPDRYPDEIDINDVVTTMGCGEIYGACIDGNAYKSMINTSEKSLDDAWMNVYFSHESDVAVYDYYFVIKDSKGDAANSWKLRRRGISLDIDWSESNDITYYYDIVPRETVNITVDYKAGTGIRYASGNNIGKIRGLWNGAYIREKLPNAKNTDGVSVDANCDKTKTAASFSNYKVDPFAKLFLIEENGVAYRIKSLDVTRDGKVVETPPYDLIPEGISYIDISGFKSGNYKILVELEPVIPNKFIIEKAEIESGNPEALDSDYRIRITANKDGKTYYDKATDSYVFETYENEATIDILYETNDADHIVTEFLDENGTEIAKYTSNNSMRINAQWSNDKMTITYKRRAYYTGLDYKPFELSAYDNIKEVNVVGATKKGDRYVPDEGAGYITFEVTTSGVYKPLFYLGDSLYKVDVDKDREVTWGDDAASTVVKYSVNVPLINLLNGDGTELKAVTIFSDKVDGDVLYINDVPTSANLVVKNTKGERLPVSGYFSDPENMYDGWKNSGNNGICWAAFNLRDGIGEEYTILVDDRTVTGFELTNGTKVTGKTFTYRYEGNDCLGVNVLSKPLEWVKFAGKSSVTQSLGKKVTYKVTNNLGAALNKNDVHFIFTNAYGIECTAYNTEGLPSNLGVSFDNDTISIFQNRDNTGYFIENLEIEFAANGERKSVNVLFNDNYLANAVATAKVVSASDIALNLELSTNGISAWEDGNVSLFYRVGCKQISGDKLVDVVQYIPVGTGKAESYPLYVLGNSKDDEGNGRAEDFKLSTTLVVGCYNEWGTLVEVSESNKTSVLAKVSTKNPAYATSFSLKAVKAKINSSERGRVLVAKGVFDKNATYLNLDSLVKIVDCPKDVTEDEARTALAPYTVSDSLYINASNSEGKIPAGVYTFEVSSEKNEGSNMRAATARFKLTVLQDIILEDVTANLSTNSVAKKTKGNATVKTIVNYPVIAGKTYKPARISYAITAYSDYANDAIMNRQVTINAKTGVVSVSSDYVVAPKVYGEDPNKFGVVALVSDKYGALTDSWTAAFAGTFVVKDVAETIVIDSVKLKATDGNYVDLSAPVTTDVVNGKEIVVLDKEGNAIDTDSLAITVAGAKLVYNNMGKPVIDSPKLGTVTVTAKTADGGNSTAKLVAKTKYATPDDIVLGVDTSYDDEVEVPNGKEYIPGFDWDGKPFGNAYEFLKIKVKVKFGEEIIDAFADAAPLTNIAVSVSSGGILTKNVTGGYYTLEIKRDKVAEIAIKDKTSGNIYKYTFTNEYFGNRGVVKSLKAVSKLYATDALSNSDSASQVVWIKPNVKLDEKYVLVLDYIVDDELLTLDNAYYDATKGAFGAEFYGKIPKGKLKCYGFIMDSTKLGVLDTPSLEPPVPGDYIVDGPISFTITTTATPTYSVADTTVKTKQSVYGRISNIVPKVTNCTIVGIDDRDGSKPYRNAVVNGKVNDATSLWTVVYNNETGALDVVLKNNYPLREIDKADLIQYVTIEVEDVFGCTQYVQIKVTLNPATVKECTGEHTIEGTHCTKCGYYTGDN